MSNALKASPGSSGASATGHHGLPMMSRRTQASRMSDFSFRDAVMTQRAPSSGSASVGHHRPSGGIDRSSAINSTWGINLLSGSTIRIPAAMSSLSLRSLPIRVPAESMPLAMTWSKAGGSSEDSHWIWSSHLSPADHLVLISGPVATQVLVADPLCLLVAGVGWQYLAGYVDEALAVAVALLDLDEAIAAPLVAFLRFTVAAFLALPVAADPAGDYVWLLASAAVDGVWFAHCPALSTRPQPLHPLMRHTNLSSSPRSSAIWFTWPTMYSIHSSVFSRLQVRILSQRSLRPARNCSALAVESSGVMGPSHSPPISDGRMSVSR